MELRPQTLYSTLSWEWARAVSAGKAQLSQTLEPVLFPQHGPSTELPPGFYYMLVDELLVPDAQGETVIVAEFPPSVDLSAYEEPPGDDMVEIAYYLPKHVIDLARVEFVPHGALVHLAKAELSALRGLDKCSIEDQIDSTPKQERAGQFGYYHLLAYRSIYGDFEDDEE